jgi:hypothetical protein
MAALLNRIRLGLQWRFKVFQEKWHNFLWKAKLRIKWSWDSLFLPLMPAHKHLYRIIHEHYYKEMGYFPNLIRCRDYNDKMQWLKLFDQDELIVQCSDKLGVREFSKERVGEQHLLKVYQVAETWDGLDFERLPDAFVLKTNHDSGTVVLVRNKHEMDITGLHNRFAHSLSRIYGVNNGEWGYSGIKPRIFAEEFLEPEYLRQPPDYKFHCVDGKVKLLQYIYDRGAQSKEQMIDRNGVDSGFVFDHRFLAGNTFIKPGNWLEMVEIAEKLAHGFKYVRVDLYHSKGQIFVGELTFWPMAGCYHGEGQKIIGKYLDFDRKTYKKPIYQRLVSQ